jgi:hypothetical protein
MSAWQQAQLMAFVMIADYEEQEKQNDLFKFLAASHGV